MIGRPLAWICSVTLLACQTPPEPQTPTPSAESKAPETANRPVKQPIKPVPLLSPSAKPSPCVRQCLDASQMQARAWEAIVEDCKKSCQSR